MGAPLELSPAVFDVATEACMFCCIWEALAAVKVPPGAPGTAVVGGGGDSAATRLPGVVISSTTQLVLSVYSGGWGIYGSIGEAGIVSSSSLD